MFLRFSFLTSIILAMAICGSGQANPPLPHWMTAEEAAIFHDYLNQLPEGKSVSPPAHPPRTPGEYEENQGVLITWASYSAELREIVRYARESVTVYIVCSNIAQVQNYLTQGNVPLDNIEFIQAAFNSVWVRDYGPQSIYLAESQELALVDWVYNRPRPSDNLIPGVMAGNLNVPIFQMTTNPNRLVATGGNFIADGHGTMMSSKLILAENPSLSESQIDQIMYDYLGINRYIKMNELPYDNISHIDMHMKLLDDETLLVGEFPQGVSDGPFIEANLNYLLSNYLTPYDRPYEVVRVPMVPSSGGSYPPQSAYRTFTNSVILNDRVLVPTYGHYLDDEALQIYQQAMPGYQVVGINMNNVITASGAIHCITREIAADDPIFIAHARVREPELSENGYTIRAMTTSASGIQHARLHWKLAEEESFTVEPMQWQNDSLYAWIPRQEEGIEIQYFLSATNHNEKTIHRPLTAPQGYYRFFGEYLPPDDVLLHIMVDGQGSTQPLPGIYEMEPGTQLTITAQAEDGWEFVEWIVEQEADPAKSASSKAATHKEENSAEITISLNENTLVTAVFQEEDHTSIAIAGEKLRFAVWPNPASSYIDLSLAPVSQHLHIGLYDLHGKVLIEQIYQPSSGDRQLRWSLNGVPAGVYLIRLQTDTQTISRKLIVN